MHKKYHEKFKISGILAVTTQAREGIETCLEMEDFWLELVTTQAREGIETFFFSSALIRPDAGNNSSPRGH